jgi:hypothetical protein
MGGYVFSIACMLKIANAAAIENLDFIWNKFRLKVSMLIKISSQK